MSSATLSLNDAYQADQIGAVAPGAGFALSLIHI